MNEERKELFSEKVSLGNRTYFFDVKESAEGVKYLVITESKQTGGKSYKRSRVMVFEEDVQRFNAKLQKAIKFLRKGGERKAYKVEQIRLKYPRAYEKWTEEEEYRLTNEYIRGKTTAELAKILQRKPGAIRSRLKKLGLL